MKSYFNTIAAFLFVSIVSILLTGCWGCGKTCEKTSCHKKEIVILEETTTESPENNELIVKNHHEEDENDK